MKCSICGEKIKPQLKAPYTKNKLSSRMVVQPEFWYGGHNAAPLTEGRCCTECNTTKVIPARVALMFKDKK